jgi:hypothetical protein
LALVAVGLYGDLSFTAAQRTNEFGIRMALEAQRRWHLLLHVGQGRELRVGVQQGPANDIGSSWQRRFGSIDP